MARVSDSKNCRRAAEVEIWDASVGGRTSRFKQAGGGTIRRERSSLKLPFPHCTIDQRLVWPLGPLLGTSRPERNGLGRS